MPSPETILALAAATIVFAYLPGPMLLCIAAPTPARVRRAGSLAALGIHTGSFAHVFTALVGLAVLFDASPVLYLMLKIIGAIYLVYLGLSLIIHGGVEPHDIDALPAKTGRRAFLEIIFVEGLNPKITVFFVAFLPQFVDLGLPIPVWAQFLILGTIVYLTFTSADLVGVLLAGAVFERLTRPTVSVCLTRQRSGGLPIGLGAHLALHRN
ncbi:MAG: LysE family translocator [Pseudomonadota bacterium]